jgi:hypothetical protein
VGQSEVLFLTTVRDEGIFVRRVKGDSQVVVRVNRGSRTSAMFAGNSMCHQALPTAQLALLRGNVLNVELACTDWELLPLNYENETGNK